MPWWAWTPGLVLLALMLVWAVWDGLREEKRETEILSMLLVYRDLTVDDMAQANRRLITWQQVQDTLERLERDGLVSSRESGRAAMPRYYTITELGRTEAIARAEARAA